MSLTRLAIKIDVDTRRGAVEGVPRLRDILASRRVPASFFFSLGPDNSGRALARVFTRKGFLAKMIRTGAPSAYGLRTLCYGTLLPAPIIGRGLGPLARELDRAGHELGLHAWDHVAWHDRLWKMRDEEVEAEVARGIAAFEAFAGRRPQGFAAPAWRVSPAAARALSRAGLLYLSGVRGRFPFRPRFDGRAEALPEIPTTLPTADEVLGRNGVGRDDLAGFFLKEIEAPGLHVLTVHAELEGLGLAGFFDRFLAACRDRGVEFIRLIDLARGLTDLPEIEVIKKEIPGRAGRVSHQGP
ncbi:MAG: polysaccharide deacetylase family protein [Pseudomonadota bacterium]